MAGFRFSYNIFGIHSRAEFVATCQRAENLGYDTVFAADHLGIAAPFPALVAAAAATERLRVGTLVLNAPFWNPALLAREVATTDVLTDGRLELGLGAGHMRWEFDEAGVGWEPFGARADRLESTIHRLGREFAGDGYPQQAALREEFGMPVPRPVQRVGFGGHGPPLLVGGTAERILRIAVRYADIVGVAGVVQVHGAEPGTFRVATAAEAGRRVRFAREQAGERAERLEWHALVQVVAPTDDRRAAAEALAARHGQPLAAEDLLDSPFLLLGTPAQMAEQLLRNRETYGFTYYTVHGPYLDAFAPVIERVRAASG